MESLRKRHSLTAVEDLEAQHRHSQNSKRQRVSSTKPDETLVQRFKQPEHLLGPQICALCERNITKSVKVLCAECKPDGAQSSHDGAKRPELAMCLECLRLGKTSEDFPEHLPTHGYYVYDNLDFPLLHPEWSASQEIRLIQGIMKCGLGNWTDIAEQFLNGQKKPKDCEEHYFAVLMQQTEKINYQTVLTYRANKALSANDDHKLDAKKKAQVEQLVRDYRAMKARDKELEDREFSIGAQQQGAQSNAELTPNPKTISAPPMTKQGSSQLGAQQMSSQQNQLQKQNC